MTKRQESHKLQFQKLLTAKIAEECRRERGENQVER